jgi:hypothetical protein
MKMIRKRSQRANVNVNDDDIVSFVEKLTMFERG